MPAWSDPTVPTAASDDDAEMPSHLGRYTVLGRLGSGGMGVVLEALDPALDRKVAIKVLWPSVDTASDASTARLEREAQAMARLAHPNVVTVFEVDRLDDRVYVAMELVKGATLRDWLAEEPRSWRQIVEIFIAAGRGLAAAHAAGLVHRDFKPDNVLIGADGRPRVSDFGLVAETAREPVDELAPITERALDLTLRGSMVGTPAYMSPEQWSGEPLDARGDQFAFCVALWEALYGARPFPGTTYSELRAGVRAGTITVPAERRRVPRWLAAVLRRGLAVDREARWPDLSTLLDELARRSRARRRWTVAAIAMATAIASAATAVLVVDSHAAADPCASPTERVAVVWSPVRATLLRARFASVDPQSGSIRASKIVDALDTGARDWSAMHVEACRATRLEGRQSDTLLDRRMECLDRWLGQLGQTVGAIEHPQDRATVDNAVHAASSLSPLSACADLHALAEAVPLPTNPVERTRAIALADRAEAIEVARRAGKLDGLLAKSRALSAEAKAFGHPPTVSLSLGAQARVELVVGERSAAEATLRELGQFAARAHDDHDAAYAWTQLVQVIGVDEGKRDEALALLPTATAAVLRAGEPTDLRVELLYEQATFLDYGGHPAEGLKLLEQARTLLEAPGAESLAPRLADVAFESGTAHAFVGDWDKAVASYRYAIERWRAAYGVDSPDEAFGWQNLGAVFQLDGRKEEALEAFRHAARIREARMGETPTLVFSLAGVGTMLNDLGRWEEALAVYDRALRIDRAQLPADSLEISTVLVGRGVSLGHLDRPDEARRGYDEVIALYTKVGGNTYDLPAALHNRAELAARGGHCAEALPDYTRALALFGEQLEPSSRSLIEPLLGEGRCLVQLRRPGDAIAPLERILTLKLAAGDAVMLARARYYLGRAKVEANRDRPGGLAMVRDARGGLAGEAEVLAELDAWLHEHSS